VACPSTILVILSLVTTAAPSVSEPTAPPSDAPRRATRVALVAPACELRQAGADALASERCLACHGGQPDAPSGCSHPVSIRYQSARGYDRGRLHSEGDVERRGVLLLDGRVECVSCHDGASRWGAHVVLLPGAPSDAPSLPPGQGHGDARRPGRARPGGAVDTTALCNACHQMSEF
jgi:hypothetical protein